MLADYWDVYSTFFITYNSEERTGRVVFLVMSEGADERAYATARAFLWVDN